MQSGTSYFGWQVGFDLGNELVEEAKRRKRILFAYLFVDFETFILSKSDSMSARTSIYHAFLD